MLYNYVRYKILKKSDFMSSFNYLNLDNIVLRYKPNAIPNANNSAVKENKKIALFTLRKWKVDL